MRGTSRAGREWGSAGSVGWEHWGTPALCRPGTEVLPSHQKTVMLVGTERRAGRITDPSKSTTASPLLSQLAGRAICGLWLKTVSQLLT